MKECNFSYEKMSDNLFLFEPLGKSVQSISIGNFILDYNMRGILVGIEIINASSTLAECVTDKDTCLCFLSSLKECYFEIKKTDNFLILKLDLKSKIEEIHPILYLSFENLPITC